MSSVTLTNISGYVETQRIEQTEAGELDTVTSTFTGPSSQFNSFLPSVGSKHPSYPLMQVWSSSDTDTAGGILTSCAVTYKGRMKTNGSSTFVSESVLTESWTEKEFAYQARSIQNLSTIFNFQQQNTQTGQVTGGVESINNYRISQQSWSIRYLTKTIKIKYCCNFLPNAPQFQTKGFSLCGIQYQYNSLLGISTTYASSQQELNNLPVLPVGIQQNILTNFEIEQYNNWCECHETYERRWVFAS